MKKTVSMLLAVIMAAIAVCSFSVIGFAEPANDDPEDFNTTVATTEAPTTQAPATEAPTTQAPATEEATTAAVTGTTVAEGTTKNPLEGILGMLTTTNLSDILASEPVVTRDPSQTYIDDGDATTKAPATTKKPAKVESSIPSTGSAVVVPAIALLALAAGTVAVVKTKKED